MSNIATELFAAEALADMPIQRPQYVLSADLTSITELMRSSRPEDNAEAFRMADHYRMSRELDEAKGRAHGH